MLLNRLFNVRNELSIPICFIRKLLSKPFCRNFYTNVKTFRGRIAYDLSKITFINLIFFEKFIA